MNELLKLQDISKRYRKNNIDALRNISFQCAKGDVISIVGSSGSGKSTLLRIIAGLEIPDEGEITLEKNKINGSGIFLTPEKRNCSLVFQDFALFPNMSVKENIFFGKNASKNKSIIDELIEFTRIKNLLERFPHEISGGQQQRVALVRALSINPALLLLDEPLSHLDHELKHQVRNELKNLIKKVGATVLMVTHDTEDAMYMANKVLVLNNGVVDQIDHRLLQLQTVEPGRVDRAVPRGGHDRVDACGAERGDRRRRPPRRSPHRPAVHARAGVADDPGDAVAAPGARGAGVWRPQDGSNVPPGISHGVGVHAERAARS